MGIASLLAAIDGCTADVAGLCDNGDCIEPVDGGADVLAPDNRHDGDVSAADGSGDASFADGSSDASDSGDATPVCDTTIGPQTNDCVNSEEIAVYVAPNGDDTTGTGTKANPFATVGKATNAAKSAKKSVVLACGGTYTSTIALTIADDGTKIYGGLTCPGDAGAGWTYTGAKAIVAPTTRGYALSITGLTTGMTIEDFEFDALDGDPAKPGDSSIAVLVDTSQTVVFRRVIMTAGAGVNGKDGDPGSNYTAVKASPGNSAVSAIGATSVSCACKRTDPLRGPSVGASGGNGGAQVTDGGDGLPDLSGSPPNDGKGGAGEKFNGNSCTIGDRGASGPAKAGGQGATSRGALASGGWSTAAASGADGIDGTVAQGGGGGGGALDLEPPASSGGGGAGGCGGCGGGGGQGGKAGGSSFALAYIASGITLDGCTLKSGTAGAGGKGGDGQVGQLGGDRGGGNINGCPGGVGGTGGAGGGGGGGAGGNSVAIAYSGTAPKEIGTNTKDSAPSGGTGGAPGSGGATAATKGADGLFGPAKPL
jgi:hypothetical protein